ncbi:MAG: hypothetical protein K0A90_00060 [Methanosarcinaceae archaeon]|nr:hypothetical protein [Methanosarcinaceae archaeon]
MENENKYTLYRIKTGEDEMPVELREFRATPDGAVGTLGEWVTRIMIENRGTGYDIKVEDKQNPETKYKNIMRKMIHGGDTNDIYTLERTGCSVDVPIFERIFILNGYIRLKLSDAVSYIFDIMTARDNYNVPIKVIDNINPDDQNKYDEIIGQLLSYEIVGF